MLISENGSKPKFKDAPEGVHLAICYGLVDLGTQTSVIKGETTSARKIRIFWELHGEDSEGKPLTLDDGRPLSVSERYTLSLNEKANLRQMLTSWRGSDFTKQELKGFDLRSIIGKPCMVTVTHNIVGDRTWVNVKAVTGVPSAMKKLGLPTKANPDMYFSFGYFDGEEFEALPKGLQEVIMKAPEWEERQKIKSVTSLDDVEDDIPFN